MKKPRRKCTEDIAGTFPAYDIDKGRICAALSYIVFFIPIIVEPESRFGRYHANQSLILLLLSTVGVTLLTALGLIGMILSLLVFAFCLTFGVRGFILALERKAKCIPLLGNWDIIAFEPKL